MNNSSSNKVEISITQYGKGNTQNNSFNIGKQNKPIVSNVRAGSKNFVGRDQELEEIHSKLQAGYGVAICAVEGMGGVGKTELALQYAQKHQQDYAAQYWLPIRNRGLAQAVVELASPFILLPEELQSKTLEQQAEWYWQNWLPAEGNLLVILDDVPNAQAIPDAAMPFDPRVKVLLTTQERMLSSNFEHLTVEVLTLDDAITLLSKILELAGGAKGLSRVTNALSIVEEVCEIVGYLPLGVELIGEYLAKNRHLSFEALRNRLHLADPSLAQNRSNKLYGYRGVEAAIQLSWDNLCNASKQVAMLLSLFAPVEISWAIVKAVVENTEITDADLDEARGQLDRLHLIKPTNEDYIFYKIHTLVREFFGKQLKQQETTNHVYRQAFVQSLLNISKQISHTPTLDQIANFKPAIPHLELLYRKMIGDIANPQQDLVWAFVGVANYYYGQGLYALAEVPLQACLLATKQQLGADHPSTATSLNNLAALYQLQGHYNEAESLYIQSLQIREQQLGADHPDTAASLNNLAKLYRSQGRYSEAEPLYMQSLQIYKQQLGADHPNTATSLNNLAELYESQGRYSEAEPLYIQALQICEQQLGADHPDTAANLNNLAKLYESQGRYSEAELLLVRALQICEKQLGADHPSTAISLGNLAGLYESQGRYSEAEPLYIRALQIHKQQLGADHPSTATSLNNLAGLYRSQGRYSKAEPLYIRALQISEQQLGADHPSTATSLNNLAGLYESQGRYSEAEPLLVQALQIHKQQLGADHPSTAISLGNLAKLYESQGRYSEAEPLYLRALKIREKQLGVDHPDTALSLNNLAMLYEAQGKYTKAQTLAQRALAILQNTLGNEHSNLKTPYLW